MTGSCGVVLGCNRWVMRRKVRRLWREMRGGGIVVESGGDVVEDKRRDECGECRDVHQKVNRLCRG